MSEWQPIETAPTDGSNVLCGHFVFSPADNGNVAMWIAETYCSVEGKWQLSGFDDSINLSRRGRYKPPTHWMPLPAPPA